MIRKNWIMRISLLSMIIIKDIQMPRKFTPNNLMKIFSLRFEPSHRLFPALRQYHHARCPTQNRADPRPGCGAAFAPIEGGKATVVKMEHIGNSEHKTQSTDRGFPPEASVSRTVHMDERDASAQEQHQHVPKRTQPRPQPVQRSRS